jgi:uncharacterized repeat protein (TIGR02543 family)
VKLSSGDAAVTANFTLDDPYEINYVLNGGSNGSNTPLTYTIAETPVTLVDAIKPCNFFDGWYDNSGFSGSSVTSIPAGSTGPKTYYAKWTADAPFGVTITGSPGTVCAGADVTLSVSGSYSTYQWYHGAQQLTTQSSLALNNVTSADGGTYTCNVTNGNGCPGTGSASLTVNATPTITDPSLASVCEGGSGASMTVYTSSGATLQWYRGNPDGSHTALSNSSNYTGVDLQTLVFNNVDTDLDDSYYCVATSGNCQTVSATAHLTVRPLIASNPSSASGCVGDNVAFTVSAPCGTWFEWHHITSGGSDLEITSADEVWGYSGYNTNQLTITNISPSLHFGNYYCIVSNIGASQNSTQANLIFTIPCE